MKKHHHIVVGIDFSDASRAALNAAVRLADFDGASITVAHILDTRLAAAMQKVQGFDHTQLINHLQDSVHRFLAEAGLADRGLHLHLDVDHPFPGLVSACCKKDADLLVLGTSGVRGGINELGPVAAKCLAKAPADVLLVREDMRGRFKKAVVCVDFSDTSTRAVKAAAQLSECDGTELDFVYVYESPSVLLVDYNGIFPTLNTDGLADVPACTEIMINYLSPLLKAHGNIPWKAEVHENSSIRSDIIHHAETNHADLVVIGTRGATSFENFLMGTTAESILRHAGCSVLAIKPEDHLLHHLEEMPHSRVDLQAA